MNNLVPNIRFEYFGHYPQLYIVLMNGNYTLFDSEFCKLLNITICDLYKELSTLAIKPLHFYKNIYEADSINILYYSDVIAANKAIEYLNNKYLVMATLLLS